MVVLVNEVRDVRPDGTVFGDVEPQARVAERLCVPQEQGGVVFWAVPKG